MIRKLFLNTVGILSFLMIAGMSDADIPANDMNIKQNKNAINIVISIENQILYLREDKKTIAEYLVSTGSKPPSEIIVSGGTPRGKHIIIEIIGLDQKKIPFRS